MSESTMPLYEPARELVKRTGLQPMGLNVTWAFHDDPKHLLFSMARYKFVAKMLEGANTVLEVGCADGFFTRLVLQSVGTVTGIDIDADLIRSAQETMSERWRFDARLHDMLERPVEGPFDAAYALDVLEHIPAELEGRFLANLLASLKPTAPLILGLPSLQSQAFASKQSRAFHVNCKDQMDLKTLMRRYFHNVFAFSMNDEVVHTGFHAMAHYNLVLCSHRRSDAPC